MPHADSCDCKRSAKRSRADSRIDAPVGRAPSKDFARRDKLAFSLSSWPATRVSPNASGTSTSGSVFYSNRRAKQKSTCDCWKNTLMILNATRSSLVKWVGLNSWIPGIGVRSSMRCRMKTQRKRTTVESTTHSNQQRLLKDMICIVLPSL